MQELNAIPFSCIPGFLRFLLLHLAKMLRLDLISIIETRTAQSCNELPRCLRGNQGSGFVSLSAPRLFATAGVLFFNKGEATQWQ